MSNLIPNSFQLPNAFVDHLMMQLSGNATKCYLLVVRKTVGWGKESDRISISQFQKHTGVNDKKTIHKVVKELEEFGLILSKKERGLITEFSLNFEPLDQYQKTTPVPKNTSTKKRVKSSTKKRYSTKDTIQNPIKEKRNKKESLDLSEIDFPKNLHIPTWQSWMDYKQQIKKPYKTERGIKTAMNQLAELSHEQQEACINSSIMNEYQGFFVDKFRGQVNASNTQRPENKYERSFRESAEYFSERGGFMGSDENQIPGNVGGQKRLKLL
ncbi:MAG: replication protein [Ignavibacteriaceae bacterium]|nr:replication protein [Ignavibacteriaceae bacterium]